MEFTFLSQILEIINTYFILEFSILEYYFVLPYSTGSFALFNDINSLKI